MFARDDASYDELASVHGTFAARRAVVQRVPRAARRARQELLHQARAAVWGVSAGGSVCDGEENEPMSQLTNVPQEIKAVRISDADGLAKKSFKGFAEIGNEGRRCGKTKRKEYYQSQIGVRPIWKHKQTDDANDDTKNNSSNQVFGTQTEYAFYF